MNKEPLLERFGHVSLVAQEEALGKLTKLDSIEGKVSWCFQWFTRMKEEPL